MRSQLPRMYNKNRALALRRSLQLAWAGSSARWNSASIRASKTAFGAAPAIAASVAGGTPVSNSHCV